MKIITALAGGLAGACALTLLHQAIKKADKDAPHVDELGMEALSKGLETVGVEPPRGEKLYNLTLTGDIIANTMYYSLAAIGGRSNIGGRTTFLGLLAGLGAAYLPKHMHLSTIPTERTQRTQYLTIAEYTFGGLVAGVFMKVLSIGSEKKKRKMEQLKAIERANNEIIHEAKIVEPYSGKRKQKLHGRNKR